VIDAPTSPAPASHVFLTAEWRNLAMLNYRVPTELLAPFVPEGTTLDLWNGSAYVSVVGFLFAHTRLLGASIPFHRTFEEVNLRFYVRRDVQGECRRAVTFIRELVPRAAIATVARLAYNEPYLTRRMRHQLQESYPDAAAVHVEYQWKGARGWNGIHLDASDPPEPLRPGSEEEFIAQHYWGYTRQRDRGTVEYEVRHPRWNVQRARSAALTGDLRDVYPPEFLSILAGPPDSAFLADGSPITVYKPKRLLRPI
jgi:hypothetical protein